MRGLLFVFVLFLAVVVPAVAVAQEEDEEADVMPLPALAIAAYYDYDLETIGELHEAGMGYGLIFHIMPLLLTDQVTVQELVEWQDGGSGWGILIKAARATRTTRANLGTAIREYKGVQRAERGNQPGRVDEEEIFASPAETSRRGPPAHAGPPPHAGAPAHAGPKAKRGD